MKPKFKSGQLVENIHTGEVEMIDKNYGQFVSIIGNIEDRHHYLIRGIMYEIHIRPTRIFRLLSCKDVKINLDYKQKK